MGWCRKLCEVQNIFLFFVRERCRFRYQKQRRVIAETADGSAVCTAILLKWLVEDEKVCSFSQNVSEPCNHIR